MEKENKKTSVFIKDLCSAEHYTIDKNKYTPVLQEINLQISEGEIFGISAENQYEADVLCKIIANISSYISGKCVLGNKGMMKSKKRIVESLFYIKTSTMVYENMTVLEYLMFCTAKLDNNPIERQKQIFEFLISIGLDYISLSAIKILTAEEKILIELICAIYSNSSIIVLNIIEYDFSDSLISVLEKLCSTIKQLDKTLIIGTIQAKIIGICCDNTTYILDSKQKYCGSVETLCKNSDRVLYVLTDSNIEELFNTLNTYLPEYDYNISNNSILVLKKEHCERNDSLFFEALAKYEIFPDYIKINRGRVQNSFEELKNACDIQEQLLL